MSYDRLKGGGSYAFDLRTTAKMAMANEGNGPVCSDLALLSGSMQRRGNFFLFFVFLVFPLHYYVLAGLADFSKQVA